MTCQRGISKFEFLVVVAVIGVLSLVGLAKLRQLQEMGEKTVVEATIRNIESGLRYEMGHQLTQGKERLIAAMVGSNPVQWLEKPPTGYLGEFDQPPRDLAPGQWFFDRERRELVYLPRLHGNLQVEAKDGRLRWRIEPAGGRLQTSQITRVRVALVAGYRWF